MKLQDSHIPELKEFLFICEFIGVELSEESNHVDVLDKQDHIMECIGELCDAEDAPGMRETAVQVFNVCQSANTETLIGNDDRIPRASLSVRTFLALLEIPQPVVPFPPGVEDKECNLLLGLVKLWKDDCYAHCCITSIPAVSLLHTVARYLPVSSQRYTWLFAMLCEYWRSNPRELTENNIFDRLHDICRPTDHYGHFFFLQQAGRVQWEQVIAPFRECDCTAHIQDLPPFPGWVAWSSGQQETFTPLQTNPSNSRMEQNFSKQVERRYVETVEELKMVVEASDQDVLLKKAFALSAPGYKPIINGFSIPDFQLTRTPQSVTDERGQKQALQTEPTDSPAGLCVVVEAAIAGGATTTIQRGKNRRPLHVRLYLCQPDDTIEEADNVQITQADFTWPEVHRPTVAFLLCRSDRFIVIRCCRLLPNLAVNQGGFSLVTLGREYGLTLTDTVPPSLYVKDSQNKLTAKIAVGSSEVHNMYFDLTHDEVYSKSDILLEETNNGGSLASSDHAVSSEDSTTRSTVGTVLIHRACTFTGWGWLWDLDTQENKQQQNTLDIAPMRLPNGCVFNLTFDATAHPEITVHEIHTPTGCKQPEINKICYWECEPENCLNVYHEKVKWVEIHFEKDNRGAPSSLLRPRANVGFPTQSQLDGMTWNEKKEKTRALEMGSLPSDLKASKVLDFVSALYHKTGVDLRWAHHKEVSSLFCLDSLEETAIIDDSLPIPKQVTTLVTSLDPLLGLLWNPPGQHVELFPKNSAGYHAALLYACGGFYLFNTRAEGDRHLPHLLQPNRCPLTGSQPNPKFYELVRFAPAKLRHSWEALEPAASTHEPFKLLKQRIHETKLISLISKKTDMWERMVSSIDGFVKEMFDSLQYYPLRAMHDIQRTKWLHLSFDDLRAIMKKVLEVPEVKGFHVPPESKKQHEMCDALKQLQKEICRVPRWPLEFPWTMIQPSVPPQLCFPHESWMRHSLVVEVEPGIELQEIWVHNGPYQQHIQQTENRYEMRQDSREGEPLAWYLENSEQRELVLTGQGNEHFIVEIDGIVPTVRQRDNTIGTPTEVVLYEIPCLPMEVYENNQSYTRLALRATAPRTKSAEKFTAVSFLEGLAKDKINPVPELASQLAVLLQAIAEQKETEEENALLVTISPRTFHAACRVKANLKNQSPLYCRLRESPCEWTELLQGVLFQSDNEQQPKQIVTFPPTADVEFSQFKEKLSGKRADNELGLRAEELTVDRENLETLILRVHNEKSTGPLFLFVQLQNHVKGIQIKRLEKTVLKQSNVILVAIANAKILSHFTSSNCRHEGGAEHSGGLWEIERFDRQGLFSKCLNVQYATSLLEGASQTIIRTNYGNQWMQLVEQLVDTRTCLIIGCKQEAMMWARNRADALASAGAEFVPTYFHIDALNDWHPKAVKLRKSLAPVIVTVINTDTLPWEERENLITTLSDCVNVKHLLILANKFDPIDLSLNSKSARKDLKLFQPVVPPTCGSRDATIIPVLMTISLLFDVSLLDDTLERIATDESGLALNKNGPAVMANSLAKLLAASSERDSLERLIASWMEKISKVKLEAPDSLFIKAASTSVHSVDNVEDIILYLCLAFCKKMDYGTTEESTEQSTFYSWDTACEINSFVPIPFHTYFATLPSSHVMSTPKVLVAWLKYCICPATKQVIELEPILEQPLNTSLMSPHLWMLFLPSLFPNSEADGDGGFYFLTQPTDNVVQSLSNNEAIPWNTYPNNITSEMLMSMLCVGNPFAVCMALGTTLLHKLLRGADVSAAATRHAAWRLVNAVSDGYANKLSASNHGLQDVAALFKWWLMSSDLYRGDVPGIHPNELAVLLDARVDLISIPMDNWVDTIVQLDAPRGFLLHPEQAGLKQQILDTLDLETKLKPETEFGVALIELLVHPCAAGSRIRIQPLPGLLFDISQNSAIHWSSKADSLQPVIGRLRPTVSLYLLDNYPEAFDNIWELTRRCIYAIDKKEAKVTYLERLLSGCIESNNATGGTRSLPVVQCMLVDKLYHNRTTASLLHSVIPLLPGSFMQAVLTLLSASPPEWNDFQRFKVKLNCNHCYLPVVGLRAMQDKLLDQFAGEWSDTQLDENIRTILNIVGLDQMQYVFNITNPNDHLSLHVYAWCLHPVTPLDVSEGRLLAVLLATLKKPIGFVDRVQQLDLTASTIARFLAQQPVDSSSMIFNCVKLGYTTQDEANKKLFPRYTVAQKGSGAYSAYVMRYQYAPLAEHKLQHLDRLVESNRPIDGRNMLTGMDFQKTGYKLQDGFSDQILIDNLNSLVAAEKLENATCDHALLNLWAWFYAIVPESADVEQVVFRWLGITDDEKKQNKLLPKNDVSSSLTYIGHPSCIQASQVFRGGKLFGSEHADVIATVQLLQPLFGVANQPLPPMHSLVQYDIVGTPAPTDEYKHLGETAVLTLAEIVKEKIQENVDLFEAGSPSASAELSILISFLSPLSALVYAMSDPTQDMQSKGLMLLEKHVKQVLDKLGKKHSQTALFHRVLVCTFGVRCYNRLSQNIHQAIVRPFNSSSCSLDGRSCRELDWWAGKGFDSIKMNKLYDLGGSDPEETASISTIQQYRRSARDFVQTLHNNLQESNISTENTLVKDHLLEILNTAGGSTGVGSTTSQLQRPNSSGCGFRLRKDAEKSEAAQTGNGRIKIERPEPLYVRCTPILKTSEHDFYSEMNAQCGGHISQYRCPNCYTHMLVPVSWNNRQPTVECLACKGYDRRDKIAERPQWFDSFVTHEAALEALLRLPIGSTLEADGILLHHAEKGWKVFLHNIQDPKLASLPWQVLLVHQLILFEAVSPLPEVKTALTPLLHLLSAVICLKLNVRVDTSENTPSPTIESLIKWLNYFNSLPSGHEEVATLQEVVEKWSQTCKGYYDELDERLHSLRELPGLLKSYMQQEFTGSPYSEHISLLSDTIQMSQDDKALHSLLGLASQKPQKHNFGMLLTHQSAQGPHPVLSKSFVNSSKGLADRILTSLPSPDPSPDTSSTTKPVVALPSQKAVTVYEQTGSEVFGYGGHTQPTALSEYSAVGSITGPVLKIYHTAITPALLSAVFWGDIALTYMIADNTKMKEKETEWIGLVMRAPLPLSQRQAILFQAYGISATSPTKKDQAPSSSSNEKLTYNERYALYGLQQCCPFVTLRDFLGSKINLEKADLIWFVRARERYGVSFTSSDEGSRWIKRMTVQLNVNIVVKDLRDKVEANTPETVLFHAIENAFTRNRHFVYIKGFTSIPDRLLKWVAEYTHKYPWRKVFFENTDTTTNVVENMDRCTFVPDSSVKTEVSQRNVFSMNLQQPSSNQCLHSSAELITTLVVEDWIKEMKNILNLNIHSMPLFVGPPGIGKTHTATEELWKDKTLLVVRIDCSSPELVTTAIVHYITTQLPNDRAVTAGTKVVVVLDEFHMLTPEQRQEAMIELAQNHPEKYKFGIANRFDVTDEIHHKEIFKTSLRIISCAPTREKFTDVVTAHNDVSAEAKTMILTWGHVWSKILGHEMLSYGTKERILKAVQGGFKWWEHLEECMTKQASNLHPNFPCDAVKEFRARWDKEPLDFEDDDACVGLGLIALLVEVGRVIDPDVATYPEYVNLPSHMRTHMKELHGIHPTQKVWSYLMYALEGSGITPSKTCADAMWRIIENMHAIDQPTRFPIFTLQASRSPNKLFAVSAQVDLTNMASIADAFRRGFSLNWPNIQKLWKNNRITDWKGFHVMVSVFQDVLSFLEDDHLQHIVEMSPASQPDLAARVFIRSTTNRSTKFHAAWWLFRFVPLLSSHSPKVDIYWEQDGNKVVLNAMLDGNLTTQSILIKDLFLWVSRDGGQFLETSTKPKELESQIQKLVIPICEDLYDVDLLSMWNQLLAPLLLVPCYSTDLPKLSWGACLRLAEQPHCPHHAWPVIVKRLYELKSGTIHPENTPSLIEYPELWGTITASNRKDYYMTVLANSAKQSDTGLPELVQYKILTSDARIDTNPTENLIRKFTSGLQLLERDKKPVQLKKTKFLSALAKHSYDNLRLKHPVPQNLFTQFTNFFK